MNTVCYPGLIERTDNVIQLDRLLYQKEKEKHKKKQKNIQSSGQFNEVTDHIKTLLRSSDKYRGLMQDAFGNLEKKEQLKQIIYSHISSKSFLDRFSSFFAQFELDEATEYLLERIVGLDVLQPLVEVDTITDIVICDWDDIRVDDIYKGAYKTNLSFRSKEDYEELCYKFAFGSNKSFSVSKPSVHAIFPQLRVSIVGQDISPKISTSIRIISKELRLTEKLIKETGYASKIAMDFLEAIFPCVSTMITGAVGTGKTELFRYLVKTISDHAFPIMVEDTPETYLDELYPEKGIRMWKNREKIDDEKEEFGYLFHVRNAMRHNPIYLFIQESRGKEFYEILKGANTGTIVSTTLHSNDAIDAADRSIAFCQEMQHHSAEFYGKQIAKSFKVVTHVKRFNGVRKINQVVEYLGYENNEVKANILIEYDPIQRKHVVKNRMSVALWKQLNEVYPDLTHLKELAPNI
ncbi:ATPase, T2SS/T4P/T4SS family [Bacillus sp. JJ722]|uniref:ATPase, T2SS/T4P/T4SS family n=1 Tax=Bacillus sp. JJ722 TaxID=3122973 RepID=UPI002FFE92A8